MFQLLVTKAADKFQGIPSHARLLPFSVETTGGMARGAIELLEQVSLACRDTLTVWPHWQIEMEMQKAVTVAVQKGQRNNHASRIQRRGHADLVHQGGEQNGGRWPVSE